MLQLPCPRTRPKVNAASLLVGGEGATKLRQSALGDIRILLHLIAAGGRTTMNKRFTDQTAEYTLIFI
jgi:hypothetical protein